MLRPFGIPAEQSDVWWKESLEAAVLLAGYVEKLCIQWNSDYLGQ